MFSINQTSESSALELAFNEYDEGSVRVVLYPITDDYIESGNYEILTVHLIGLGRGFSQEVKIENLLISDLTGTNINRNHQDILSEITQNHSLLSVYPNPFNPATLISIDISEYCDLSLRIYDITGREVDILYDGPISQGTHSYKWDALEFSSGIYIVKMSSGKYSTSHKIQLLK